VDATAMPLRRAKRRATPNRNQSARDALYDDSIALPDRAIRATIRSTFSAILKRRGPPLL